MTHQDQASGEVLCAMQLYRAEVLNLWGLTLCQTSISKNYLHHDFYQWQYYSYEITTKAVLSLGWSPQHEELF